MKKVAFGVGKLLTSEELNARFGDLAGGSILSGFRLAPGSSSYLVSLVRDSAQGMKAILPGGTKVEETGDALDVVAVRPNLGSANRIDVLYLTYTHERGKTFDYELVEGVAGLPLDIVEHDKKLALGYITVRPRQAVIATDLTSLPIGLKKIGRFGETIKQVLFTTTDNQTVIDFEHDFLIGQNRVTLTIGGVKQFFGKDYDETSTRQLTMKEPLPGGLAGEALISTSTKVFAEDFKKETDAAKQATIDAVNAAKAANEAALSTRMNWLMPVDTYSLVATTYPNAVHGDTVMVRDTGKVFGRKGTSWVELMDVDPAPINELDGRMKSYIAERGYNLSWNSLDAIAGDWTVALQKAIDNAGSYSIIYLPPQAIKITSTIRVTKRGIRIIGHQKGRPGAESAVSSIEYYGTGPCVEIGDSSLSSYGGYQSFELNHVSLVYKGTPRTTLNNPFAVSAGRGYYGTGTYGVRDWRGGGVEFKNVQIENFNFGFWGIESDVNTFENSNFYYNKIALYLGEGSGQFTGNQLYTFGNDTSLELNGAMDGSRFNNCQFVKEGSRTNYPIELDGCRAIVFNSCWFEGLGNENEQTVPAYIRIGKSMETRDISINNSILAFASKVSNVPVCDYLVEMVKGTGIQISGLLGFPANLKKLVNFSGSSAIQDIVVNAVLRTGYSDGTYFDNNGSGRAAFFSDIYRVETGERYQHDTLVKATIEAYSQTITPNTWTRLNYNFKSDDRLVEFDTVNNRFLAKYTGYYRINVRVVTNNLSVNQRVRLSLFLNTPDSTGGTAYSHLDDQIVPTASGLYLSGSVTLKVLAGSYIDARLWSTGNLTTPNTTGAGASYYFEVTKI